MGALRFAAEAAVAGAAWLGLGLVLSDDNPLAKLGVLAALLALAGGVVGNAALPMALRALAAVAIVALMRAAAGPAPALIAAGLVGLGWWLRVRARDVALALAVLGVGLSVIGRPSLRLVLAFLGLGVVTAALAKSVGFVRRLRRTRAAGSEIPARVPLTSERGVVVLLRRLKALARAKRLAGHLHSREALGGDR